MPEFLHRFYRESLHAEGLTSFRVVVDESDLLIWAESDLSARARASLSLHRAGLEGFIALQPVFKDTYRPYPVSADAPLVVGMMSEAAGRVGVGPMAAVAGAIAEAVGRDLIPHSPEVMVENGGDIFLHSGQERRVGVFAGDSPLSGRLALRVPPTSPGGIGICTSSATVGPSCSAGAADSAVVVAENAALADAAATALGNRVKSPAHIEEALAFASGVEGVIGCLVILGVNLGVRGDLELERV